MKTPDEAVGASTTSADRTATPIIRGVGPRRATRRSSGTSRTPRKLSTSRRGALARHHVAGRGRLRDQFHHVNDITPTIYEALGVNRPTLPGFEQLPITGTSMATRWRPRRASPRASPASIRDGAPRPVLDGGKAVTRHARDVIRRRHLELYHLGRTAWNAVTSRREPERWCGQLVALEGEPEPACSRSMTARRAVRRPFVALAARRPPLHVPAGAGVAAAVAGRPRDRGPQPGISRQSSSAVRSRVACSTRRAPRKLRRVDLPAG